MATRSRIGILNSDQTVTSVYCHWDGYVEHNGRLLVTHYTDEDKIRELMALGSISSLGQDIGTKHDFDNEPRNECNAYGRDRGETGMEARLYAAVEDYLADGEEYNYLWFYGRWMVHSYATNEKWVQVTQVLEKCDQD